MNRFAWLIRRELWEHRAILFAPAIVLAMLLLGAVTGNVFLGEVRIDGDVVMDGSSETPSPLSAQDIEDLSNIRGPEDLEKLHKLEKLKELEQQKGTSAGMRTMSAGEAVAMVPEDKRDGVLVVVYAAVAAVMFLVLGTIGYFYALDALYADRRDRSVLFWKSLPLSDAETVLAKFGVAAVVIPVVAAAAGILGQLIVATGGSIKLALTGGPAASLWAPQILGGSALAVLVLALVCILWFAPLVAYLLLASAWAPKSPFLWATLPPIAVAMLEKIAFGTSQFADFMKQRMLEPFRALFQDDNLAGSAVGSMDLVSGVADLLVSSGMILGLLAAAALLAGAMWVRRYRDETI
jgi:ABC-2 type transport system permease protein